MEKKKPDYSIGLDIGTSSVGYAVINKENFKIIKKGNKKQSLWGVRLFETASTAESRRLARGTRRRYDRRRQRIKLLQEEFKEEINKVDINFYKKLEESVYNEKDLENKTVILTKEEKQQINDYNDKYPTIYHLRNHLLESKEKEDIRLVYLAIHHMIKYRGNFLYNQKDFNIDNIDVKEKLKSIIQNVQQNYQTIEIIEENINGDFFNKFEKIINIKSKTDKKVELKNLFTKILDKKPADEISKLLIGNQFNLDKLFNIEIDDKNNSKISFEGTKYEENESKIENCIGDLVSPLNELKELYDMIFIKDIFKGQEETSISKIMINKYEKHKEDLKFLKDLLKPNKKLYKKMFKNEDEKKELCIYEKYIHNKLTQEELIKEINKILPEVFSSCEDQKLIDKYNEIEKERIENKKFLPRITSTDNGKYPYQLNKDELLKIIKNQSIYYPFLLNETSDKTNKIVKLLEFRIPYYVGPLNTTTSDKNIKNKNAWLIKKQENVRITPYNFDEVVDKHKTAEEFIVRMLSNCTYLLKEKAMPNNSILYSKYKVYNELKQIKINNQNLSIDQIKDIYNKLFLKENKTITEKMFINYLKNNPDFRMYNEINITGYSADKKFANNMKPYLDFFGEDGIFENTSYEIRDAENIIKYITIFEDKEILKEKVEKEYPEISKNGVNKILRIRYSGWSNLSEKLLTGLLYFDKYTNTSKSIMDLQEETIDNFMQIINKKEYNFDELIAKENLGEINNKFDYSAVERLATSPANKRGIYQAILVVNELIYYMGYEPKNISIEMAREEGKKERNNDKKKYLEKLYEKNKKDINDYKELFSELKSQEKIDSKKLFLYFIQEGKSLYSKKPLDINKLNEYEIDHIIPRTLIKDNSIENIALVLKEENQIKGSSYILPEQYRTNEMKSWWNHLKNIDLLTNKKIYSLTKSIYKKEDVEGFINRQIVETRQICKHVISILNGMYKNTSIIYLNANLNTNYRNKFEMFKFRNLNNFHHAKDAYLTACLGEYQNIFRKHTNFDNIKEEYSKLSEEDKKTKIYGVLINSIDEKNIIFNENGELILELDKFISTVNQTMENNDVLISKKTEIKTGEFYNQTKSKKGEKGLTLKDNMPTDLYGSYTSINPSFMLLVEFYKKGKLDRRLIGIPIYHGLKSKKDDNILKEYIKKLLNADSNKEIKILSRKIPFYTKINWDGQICYLVGATDKIEVCNAIEFKIDKENMRKWKYSLNKLLNKKETSKFNPAEYENDLEEIINYIIKNVETNYKLYNNLIGPMKEYFLQPTLTLEDKENIIKEMLKLLNTKSNVANLKFLENKKDEKNMYSSSFGRKKSITAIKEFIIINSSVSGIKEYKNEF